MNNSLHEELYAGAGRTDITPPGDCLLDGFAARDHKAEGIHDNLCATAVALSANGKYAVIVGLDLLELTDEQIEIVWGRISQKYKLRPDRIFLNCSHTHAGPIVEPRFNRKMCPEGELCQPDENYIKRMLDSIVKAISTALDNLKPARATWGIGETHIGICRRAHDTSIYKGPPAGYIGIYANIPNPRKEIDRTCPVLLFTDTSARPIALIFGAACHPTTMSHPNYLVSAEYPGAARRALEEDLDGAPALFLQGIGGDIKPRQVALETSFRSGSYDDVEAVGKELAGDVKKVMESSLTSLDVKIKTALKRFPLPFDESWNEETYRMYAQENQPEHRRTWANIWLDRIDRGDLIPQTADLTLSLMELSPDLRFCGIAGELLTDMGLKIKHHFTGMTTLPCGYTNGRIGYIPDSTVLREGGYEAIESVFFINGMPAPWRKDIDDTILSAFDELAENLK